MITRYSVQQIGVMSFRVVCVLLLAASTRAAEGPVATLPTLADLRKVHYEPSPQPDLVGVPSYADLRDTLYAFQNYLWGSKLLASFTEPILTRGASGVAIFRKAAPAVVLIVVGRFQNDQFTPTGTGSGVIVNPTGYVLTNCHVACGSNGILVFLKPLGSTALTERLAYAARLITYDRLKDLALLKLVEPPANLPSIQLEDFAKIQVAEDIHVIGHPGGPEHAWSYTTGVVSQIRQNYETTFSDGEELRADLLQIQTAVNPGNSGGPVLDDEGKMIGLVSFGIVDAQNMNFAIAADEISSFVTQSISVRARGIPNEDSLAPKSQYFSGRLLDGREATEIAYPDLTVYLINAPKNKRIGLVAQGRQGAVLQAWAPGITGGFNKWLAKFTDGTEIEAKGDAGLPAVFFVK